MWNVMVEVALLLTLQMPRASLDRITPDKAGPIGCTVDMGSIP